MNRNSYSLHNLNKQHATTTAALPTPCQPLARLLPLQVVIHCYEHIKMNKLDQIGTSWESLENAIPMSFHPLLAAWMSWSRWWHWDLAWKVVSRLVRKQLAFHHLRPWQWQTPKPRLSNIRTSVDSQAGKRVARRAVIWGSGAAQSCTASQNTVILESGDDLIISDIWSHHVSPASQQRSPPCKQL